jgi:hypothetical protein
MEIAIKHSAGKLPLPENPRAWAASRLAFFQVDLLPMDAEVIFLSGELPRVHADPFDRLIAADSIQNQMPVITPDETFSALGAQRLWLNPRPLTPSSASTRGIVKRNGFQAFMHTRIYPQINNDVLTLCV